MQNTEEHQSDFQRLLYANFFFTGLPPLVAFLLEGLLSDRSKGVYLRFDIVEVSDAPPANGVYRGSIEF